MNALVYIYKLHYQHVHIVTTLVQTPNTGFQDVVNSFRPNKGVGSMGAGGCSTCLER